MQMVSSTVDRPRKANRDEVNQIYWWHRIDLGDGLVTPGVLDTKARAIEVGLPANLAGRSVLDIGAWDGYFSFEAERRGASRVVAVDQMVWQDPSVGRKGFDYARAALDSRVEAVECDVYELTPEKVGGTFDLVLFLGVLYHLQDPIRALKNVSAVAGNQLILETHVDMVDCSRPVMAFYEGTECNSDPSNWWGPNRAAVEAMLRVVGFRRIEMYSKQVPVGYKIVGSGKDRFGRMVFHAWK